MEIIVTAEYSILDLFNNPDFSASSPISVPDRYSELECDALIENNHHFFGAFTDSSPLENLEPFNDTLSCFVETSDVERNAPSFARM